MFSRRKSYRHIKTRTLNIATAFALVASMLGGALVPALSTQKASAASITYQLIAQPTTVTAEAGTGVGSIFALAEYKAGSLGWNDLVSWGNSHITATVPSGVLVSKDQTSWDSSATLNFALSQPAQGKFYIKSDTPGTYTVSLSSSVATLLSGRVNNVASATFVVTAPPMPNQAPSVPQLSAPANGTVRKSNNANQSSWHASTDPEGDAITYVYQSSLDPAFGTVLYDSTVSGPNPLTNTHIANPGEPEGSYYWRVKAVDAQGAESAWSSAWKINIDNTAPEAPTGLVWKDASGGILSNGGLTNSYTGTASWQASPSGDVTHYVYKYWNNIPGSPYKDEGTAWTTNVGGTQQSGAFNQGDGTHYICVAAADAAGNTSACGTPVSIVYDGTTPAAPSITKPLNGQSFATTPILNQWSAVTDESGIQTYQIAYQYDDGHSFTNSTCDGSTLGIGVSGKFIGCRDLTGTQRNHAPNINEQGGVTIWVRALDKAGNWSNWSTSAHYTYDATAPNVPAATMTQDSDNTSVTNGDYTNSEHFTFNLSSSPDTTRYQLKYWNDIPGSGFKESTPWTQDNLSGYSPSLGIYKDRFSQGEGKHYFVFSACDAAGNCSAYSAPFVVIFDETAPEVQIISYTESANTIQPVVTATDTNTPLTYSWSTHPDVDISDTSELSPVFTINQDGTYTFELTVTDPAGNSSVVPFTFTYETPAQPEEPEENDDEEESQQPAPQNPTFTNVLGARAANNRSSSNPTPSNNEETTGEDEPQVLSISTQDPEAEEEKTAQNIVANANSSKFLGLGWWWAGIIAALALFWLLFGRRRSDQKN